MGQAAPQVWQFMRTNWLSNRVFKSYDDIVDHCCYAWNTLTDQLWKIISIARRKWAIIGLRQVFYRDLRTVPAKIMVLFAPARLSSIAAMKASATIGPRPGTLQHTSKRAAPAPSAGSSSRAI